MPARPLRPCTHPGCHKLSTSSRCEDHPYRRFESEDSAPRASFRDRGYSSKWDRFRKAWIRQHPLCGQRLDSMSGEHSRCWREGIAAYGREVDHIIPHRGDTALFWDENNLQTLCKSCHSAKTSHEINGRRNAS